MTRSTVYLRETILDKLIRATLFDEVTDAHLTMWSATWQPAMAEHGARQTLHDKPEDRQWDWQAKAHHWRPLLSYHSFAIVCGGALQGLMLANDLKFARLPTPFAKFLVYMDYLATAPWNRPEVQQPPRYRGVGTVFMAAAIQLSLDLNYRGRLGLHALPAAEPFYRNCRMNALGRDTAYENLMYFEMTAAQAKAFRQDRKTS